LADWTPPPSSSGGQKQQQVVGNLSTFLDLQLNKIFGPSFAPVIEYETGRELGVSLYEAFRAHPVQAVGVLMKIFKNEAAVKLIIDRVTERLGQMQASPQSTELLALFERLAPMVVKERCG